MSVVIAPAHELRLATNQIEEFYAANWARKICLSDPSFTKWQFALAPTADRRNHSVVAFDQGKNEVVGAMGLNPRPFHLNGKEIHGAELTTWIVAPEQQGTGIGAKILQEIQRRYDALIGMGISALALPIYRRSGFRYLRAIPRFVRVFNEDVTASFGAITPLGRKLQTKISPIRAKYSLKDISSGRELFARLHGSFNMFDRGIEHLEWRFTKHPIFRYQTQIVEADGGGEALVISRIEDAVDGLRVLHVVDCIGDAAAMPAAISYIEESAISQNADFADVYSTAGSLNRFYLAYGWSSILDDDAIQVPHLFHPVELRHPPTTSLIYWARGGMPEMADFGRLYISKQDADLDRPVPASPTT